MLYELDDRIVFTAMTYGDIDNPLSRHVDVKKCCWYVRLRLELSDSFPDLDQDM